MNISIPSTIPGLSPLVLGLSGDLPEPQALRVALEHLAATRQPLTHRSLSGADLSGAALDGLDLTHCTLSGANLSGTSLRGAKLVRCDFRGVDARAADFTGASLELCAFDGRPTSDLSGATFDAANLHACDLSHAKLVEIEAEGATFTHCKTKGSDWRGARLVWCDVRSLEASGSIADQLAGSAQEKAVLRTYSTLRAQHDHAAARAEAERWGASLEQKEAA